ncbi:hypothetical protein [Terrarubrum flagellatum]|uniref:hypothetical protein n=1 Tax=Terrirubrum flagellatum TaxID=2895980 RepID=UPI0031454854
MNDRNSELHIFVNRRRFDATHGLTKRVTGAEIAALVNVPRMNAVVEHDAGVDALTPVDLDTPIDIENGAQFLVTREFVLGGANDARERILS